MWDCGAKFLVVCHLLVIHCSSQIIQIEMPYIQQFESEYTTAFRDHGCIVGCMIHLSLETALVVSSILLVNEFLDFQLL